VIGHTVNGHSAGAITRDDVLDNITLYWLTNTAISSARLYWENKINLYLPANVSVPAAVTVFPGENFQAPRSWAERAYHKLIYFHQVDKGGHFAAWEQPDLSARSYAQRSSRFVGRVDDEIAHISIHIVPERG
jgi:hypothetical protein